MSSDASTPLMRQYNSIKQQVPNALLMFRLGDFYELFFEDAVIAARELEITLTARNKEKGAAIPMCGVPYHAAEGYIARLIQKGHRVAICEQMEDPKFAKKLVKREITRVVTPGTAMDANLVRSRENNYLAAVARAGGALPAVAHVDVSTGEFRVTEMDAGGSGRRARAAGRARGAVPRRICRWSTAPKIAGPALRAHRTGRLGLQLATTPTAPCATTSSCSRSMAAAWPNRRRRWARPAPSCITCATRSAPRSDHLDRPTYYDRADSMVLDAVTVRNLELVEPIFAADARRQAARPRVLAVLDQTLTGMGGRLLRQRLLRPSMDRAEIEAAPGRGGRAAAADHPARGIAQAARRHSRSRAPAGQGHAGLGRAARAAGAGPLAGEDSGAEALLRYRSRPRACARCTTGWTNCPTSPG